MSFRNFMCRVLYCQEPTIELENTKEEDNTGDKSAINIHENSNLGNVNTDEDKQVLIDMIYDNIADLRIKEDVLTVIEAHEDSEYIPSNGVTSIEENISSNDKNESANGEVEFINDEVESVDGGVKSVGGEVECVDGEVECVDGKIESVDGKVESVDDKVECVDDEVECVDGGVKSVGGEVDCVDGEVECVDGKVECVDSEVECVDGEVKGKVECIDGEVECVDGKIKSVDGKIKSVDGKIKSADGEVECVDGKDVEYLNKEYVDQSILIEKIKSTYDDEELKKPKITIPERTFSFQDSLNVYKELSSRPFYTYKSPVKDESSNYASYIEKITSFFEYRGVNLKISNLPSNYINSPKDSNNTINDIKKSFFDFNEFHDERKLSIKREKLYAMGFDIDTATILTTINK